MIDANTYDYEKAYKELKATLGRVGEYFTLLDVAYVLSLHDEKEAIEVWQQFRILGLITIDDKGVHWL